MMKNVVHPETVVKDIAEAVTAVWWSKLGGDHLHAGHSVEAAGLSQLF